MEADEAKMDSLNSIAPNGRGGQTMLEYIIPLHWMKWLSRTD